MSPFSRFEVQPSYGAFRAVIQFSLRSGVAGDVYFYRSFNGEKGWEILNPNAPVQTTSGVFADTGLRGDFNALPFYRGLVDPGGPPSSWLEGEKKTAFEILHPRQRRGANAILKQEFKRMSGGKTDSTQALHYIPLKSGAPATWYDPETGQIRGVECPDAEEPAYGTAYKGGFHPPFWTWVRLVTVGPMGGSRPEALDEQKQADITLMRFLAHPMPREGHLIVLPQSDRRYAVTDTIQPYYFPGTNIPVAWEASAVLLDPSDPRYKVETPYDFRTENYMVYYRGTPVFYRRTPVTLVFSEAEEELTLPYDFVYFEGEPVFHERAPVVI